MRFFEVLLLLGLLVAFAKAQGGGTTGQGDEPIFDDEVDTAAEEAALEEEPEEDIKENIDPDATEDHAFLKDEPEENVKRQIFPPTRPPIRRYTVTVFMGIPPNANGRFFRLCYCFRRLCFVPGMYQGFRGWRPGMTYRSGYVVLGNWLYRFYLCRPGLVPRPPRPTRPRTRPLPTKPLMTKPRPTKG